MASGQSNLELSTGGLRCAAVSDVGMRRTTNQDSMAVAMADSQEDWSRHGHLFVVADGMGAHAAGELASKLATDTISHSYHKHSEDSPSEALAGVIREANTVINNKGEGSVDFQGMGTTCSCLALLPSGSIVAHVGDSRIYRLRGDCFDQLTFDHSLVWEMAAAGHATEDEVPPYVPKNVITRSLGPHPTVAVDLEGPFQVQTGDRFLLCSDGLTGPLKPELIGLVLSSLSPADATRSLVDLANLLGGPDNITVVVVEVVNESNLGDTNADFEPGQSGGGRARRKRTTSWKSITSSVLLGLGALIGAGLFVMEYQIAAIIVAAVAVFQWILMKVLCRSCKDEPCCSDTVDMRGRAPYRMHDCSPTAVNIEPLNDIVRQLEDLESERQWEFDWEPIHQDRAKAHQAIAQGNYQEAVISFCSAVRRLMQAIRDENPSPSDSTITL